MKNEREKTRAAEKEIFQLKTEMANARQLNQELGRINKFIEGDWMKNQETLLGHTKKIMQLKTAMKELFSTLGSSDAKAWFQTLSACSEWDVLGLYVSAIMAEGEAKKDDMVG